MIMVRMITDDEDDGYFLGYINPFNVIQHVLPQDFFVFCQSLRFILSFIPLEKLDIAPTLEKPAQRRSLSINSDKDKF